MNKVMNKFINKKNIFGGNDFSDNKQLQMFISIIIVGYFGIKIIYGFFFNFYPDKYYYRNIEISSNEENNELTKNIVLNAFIPGMWNNEMTDFITLLVISFTIYVFTNVSAKSFIDINGNVSFAFLMGYIIGLGYPPIYVNYLTLYDSDTSLIFKYINLVILIFFILFIILLNYKTICKLDNSYRINYTMYIVIICLLFSGLVYSKKTSKNYSTSNYFYNNGEKCNFVKNGVLQTSGDVFRLTIPFVSFILIILFSYEPSTLKGVYTFLYGILLGIIVSGISYFGFEYFLEKRPMRECNDLNECIIKEMPIPVVDDPKNNSKITPKEINSNIKKHEIKNNMFTCKSKYSLLKSIFALVIFLIVIYLIYYFICKS